MTGFFGQQNAWLLYLTNFIVKKFPVNTNSFVTCVGIAAYAEDLIIDMGIPKRQRRRKALRSTARSRM